MPLALTGRFSNPQHQNFSVHKLYAKYIGFKIIALKIATYNPFFYKIRLSR